MNPVSISHRRFFEPLTPSIPAFYSFFPNFFFPSASSTPQFSSSAISNAPSWRSGYLCERITQIWNDFCNNVMSCFSRVYRYVEGFFVTRYPEINHNMSRDALLKLYWGLGAENKWREYIDGEYQYLGEEVFDRGLHGGTVEPGFAASMESAVNYVAQALNRKIDANWYLNLHRYTCAHFNGARSVFLMGQEKVGVFRNSDDPIQCTLKNQYAVSRQAKAEFEALDRQIAEEFGPGYGLGEMTYTEPFSETVRLNYKVMNRHQILRIFNKFLNEFYREVEAAQTPDGKLTAIARLQQRLEWLHPVKDGTARTSTALMNKLLTDYGFHPAILEYPHVSSSYTLQRWKEYLQKGLFAWERERSRLQPVA